MVDYVCEILSKYSLVSLVVFVVFKYIYIVCSFFLYNYTCTYLHHKCFDICSWFQKHAAPPPPQSFCSIKRKCFIFIVESVLTL